MDYFKPRTKLNTDSGEVVEIIQKLGEGGQGVVYQIKYKNSDKYVVKWYFKMNSKKEFIKNLKNNIKKGPPSSAFIWPLDFVSNSDSFGYIMNLRPSNYKDFPKFLLGKQHFASLGAMINACLEIVSGFRSLHNAGLSYQDLNDGNFFVDPTNGNVLICDNDNVAPNGESMGILGKCRYMAPEVVLNKKKPDNFTDRFSLSVILYLMMFLNHPLEGAKVLGHACLTEELEKKCYGSEPVFVWDRNDSSNRPIRGIHTNEIKLWPLFPSKIHDMFYRSFSKDCMIGNKTRPMEKEWENALLDLRDSLIVHSCGEETFYDENSSSNTCFGCSKLISKLNVLKIKNSLVPIYQDKNIYEYQTKSDSTNYNIPTGKFREHKINKNQYGLQNNSGNLWNVIRQNGNREVLENGKTVLISQGDKIEFSSDLIGIIM